MNYDECSRVDSMCRSLDSPNLQTRDHAKQNVLLSVAQPAASLVYRYAALQFAQDDLSYLFAAFRHDNDGRVLIDAVYQEVDLFSKRRNTSASNRALIQFTGRMRLR